MTLTFFSAFSFTIAAIQYIGYFLCKDIREDEAVENAEGKERKYRVAYGTVCNPILQHIKG